MDRREDFILELVQNVIDDIQAMVDLENMIIEELLVDDIEDYPENGLVLENQNGNNVDDLLLDVIGEIQFVEDVHDDLFEEVRVIGERHHLEVDIERFRTLEDPEFYKHFRMNRGTFEMLVIEFGNHLVETNRLHRLRTELDVCLLMSLWILGNLSSFRGTGVIFGVARSVVHFHYRIVIEALRELAGKFIKWPNAVEKAAMKHRIFESKGFPGVIGMMDGTLIKVTAPHLQPARYFDRHHNYSINVLAVCDNNLCFRHVYVGEVGSAHDARVFKNSPLYDPLLERDEVIGQDEHILADSAYPLLRQVLVPFRDNGHLTRRQRRFNYVLSSIRMCIERAFGHLKEKMRRLYRFQAINHHYAVDHIMASLVLHNFIKYGGREPGGMQLPVGERNGPDAAIVGEEAEDRGRDHPLLAQARQAGTAKREAIAALLTPDD